jgi:hypothetical protein
MIIGKMKEITLSGKQNSKGKGLVHPTPGKPACQEEQEYGAGADECPVVAVVQKLPTLSHGIGYGTIPGEITEAVSDEEEYYS